MTEPNSILFFISRNDASKIEALRKMNKWFLMECYYELLKKNLNEIYSATASLRHAKDKK